LVIEWLSDGERKTGTELANILDAKDNVRVRVVPCSSAEQVVYAIVEAGDNIDEWGIPIVHFEAHGISPSALDRTSPGLSGPDGRGGEEDLLWDSIAGALRYLNFRADFRLLVVGAACYSLATLNTIELAMVAPFTVLVGFDSPVDSGRLYQSMRELYRPLFRPGGTLLQGIEAAAAELHQDTAGESLRVTTMYDFAVSLVRETIENVLDPAHRAVHDSHLAREILKIQGMALRADEVRSRYRRLLRDTLTTFFATCFAYEQVPRNRRRFSIDVQGIIERTERRYARRV